MYVVGCSAVFRCIAVYRVLHFSDKGAVALCGNMQFGLPVLRDACDGKTGTVRLFAERINKGACVSIKNNTPISISPLEAVSF